MQRFWKKRKQYCKHWDGSKIKLKMGQEENKTEEKNIIKIGF